MNNNLSKLFLIILLIFIPVATLIYTMYYEHLLEEENNQNQIIQNLSWNFDRILSYLDFTALFELLFSKIANKLHNLNVSESNLYVFKNLFDDIRIKLNKHLPKHAIYIFHYNNHNVRCLWYNNNLFTAKNKSLVNKFRELVKLLRIEKKVLNNDNLPKAFQLQSELAKEFDLLLPIKAQYDREGKFQISRNMSGNVYCFIWRKISNQNIYTFILTKIEKNEKQIISELLLAFWNENNIGLAILPKLGGKPKFSSNFNNFLKAKEFILNEVNQYNKILTKNYKMSQNFVQIPLLYAQNFSYKFLKDFVVARFLEEQNLPYHIILTMNYKKNLFFNKKFFQIYIITNLLVYVLLSYSKFLHYIEHISIARLMLVSFLLISVLPLSVLNYFFNSSSNLQVNLYIQNLESKIIKHIVGMEELVKINNANFVKLLKSFTLEKFYSEIPDNIFVNEKLAEKIQDGMIREFTKLDKDNQFHITLFLAYDKFGNKYRIKKTVKQTYSKFDIDSPLALKFKKRAEKTLKANFDNIQNKSSQTKKTSDDSFKDTIEGLKLDIIRDALYQLGGTDTYLKTLYTPNKLFELKFFYNSNFMIQTPINLKKKTFMLAFWFWDRLFSDKKLLRESLKDKLYSKPLSEENEIFVNGYLGPKHAIVPIIDVESCRNNLYVSSLSPIPALTEMIYSTYQTRLSNKKIDYTSEYSPILYTVTSKAFPGIWAAAISTKPVERIKHEVFMKKLSWLLFIFLLAISIASIAAYSFINPVNKLITIANYIRLGNYEVKIDIKRDDELGNLANTFNNLIIALKEGKILKRYVSKSVLQKISSSLEAIKAGVGERTYATIVFCSIYKFSEISRKIDPEENFKLINTHLEIIDHFTRKFGGEIDKVIGDKIMIVFFHSDFENGAREAIVNAINVIKNATYVWQKRNLPSTLVAGINTGIVISGIIGASNRKLEHTVIGDPVNLASRLNDLSKQIDKPQIFISGDTYQHIKDLYNVNHVSIRSIKGKTQQVEVYTLT